MSDLDSALYRSSLIEERIRRRTDVALREWLENYADELDYSELDELMISRGAWEHITVSGTEPRMVFAHPQLLRDNPQVSAYYRGMALLPQKRVANLASPVAGWENGTDKRPISEKISLEVARLYNIVLSSLIEGAIDWTVENGYRNIVANMGIGLDGTMRNVIGRDAERAVKDKIGVWLVSVGLLESYEGEAGDYALPNGYVMHFGSEPDIEFRQQVGDAETVVATIEVKGGRDSAGALERLGAIQKSFEATPPGCVNILIAGIVTEEMAVRLDNLGIVKRYLLEELVADDDRWAEFLNEVFHHTVRVTDFPITVEEVSVQ